MNNLPYMSFDVGAQAYLTHHLDNQEFAVYWRAVMDIWINGSTSTQRVSRLGGLNAEDTATLLGRLGDLVDGLSVDPDGTVDVAWVREGKAATEALREAKRQAGSKGGRKGQAAGKQSLSSAQAEVKQSLSTPQAELKQTSSTPQAELKQCLTPASSSGEAVLKQTVSRPQAGGKLNKEINKQINKEQGKVTQQAKEAIDHLNRVAGKAFKHVHRGDLEARLVEYSLEEVKAVIDLKAGEWKGDANMARYLRPETLFNRTKFEAYAADAAGSVPPPSQLSPEQVAAGWIERDGKVAPPMPLIHRNAAPDQVEAQRKAYYAWLQKYEWARGSFGSEVVDA